MPDVFRIDLKIEGVDQVLRGVTRVEKGVKDLRPLWRKWQVAFFSAEIDLFGKAPWPDLSEPYATWKAKHYPGKGILVRSNALKDSLVSKTGGHIFQSQPMYMEIGTSVPYAAFHQQGSGNLPVRKPLDLTHNTGVKPDGSIDKVGYFGRALVEWQNDLRKAWSK